MSNSEATNHQPQSSGTRSSSSSSSSSHRRPPLVGGSIATFRVESGDDDDTDNYETMSFPPPWLTIRKYDDYLLTRRLGTGKFSDVFEAVDVSSQSEEAIEAADEVNNDDDANDALNDAIGNADSSRDSRNFKSKRLCVIKCLKPVSERKIRRELLVLHKSRHLRNLARLQAIVLDNQDSDKDDSDRMANGDVTAVVASTVSAATAPRTAQATRSSFLRRMPAIVLQHAGPHAEWLCHPMSATATTTSCSSSAVPVMAMANTRDVERNLNGGKDEHVQKRAVEQSEDSTLFLTDYEIRYYLYHLLVAIDGLHSMGIMHRDIKPRNVLINRWKVSAKTQEEDATGAPLRRPKPYRRPIDSKTSDIPSARSTAVSRKTSSSSSVGGSEMFGPLMLIDLGLADFYRPNALYNVRVASRHYKGPELLVGYERYDYAIDMWGFGCIMAGLLLRREPFFRGKDNVDQLGKILAVLGSDDLLLFLLKYKVQVSPDIEKEIIKYHTLQKEQRQQQDNHVPSAVTSTAASLFHADNHYNSKELALLNCRPTGCPIPCRESMDLLLRLLVYDHGDRWTARQAMAHAYFDGVRERVTRELQQQPKF